MLDRRTLLSFGAAGAALPALARAQAPAAEAGVLTMPFAMRGLQPVTTCFIGGQGPFLMLIDTGNAVGFGLKPAVAEKLGLRQTGYGRLYGASGTDSAPAYLAHDVVFGQVVRQPDITFVATAGGGEGIDGILPLSLFTARPTEIDFASGQVRIHTAGSFDKAGYRPVRAERRVHTENGAFVVDVVVDGAPARLVVDTGAGTTVSLNGGFVRSKGLWEKHAHYIPRTFHGITGSAGSAREVRTPELQLGPYRFKDVIVSITDPRLTTAGEDIDGLLGVQMLRRFTLGLDPGASTLWLKPNDTLANPYPYDHAGLRLKLDAGSALVEEVYPGSPAAEAGFKAGDRLREVDTPEKLGRLEGRFFVGPTGAPVTLAVMRDGQRMPITVTPQEWL